MGILVRDMNCGNCRYFHERSQDGECRRFPPCSNPAQEFNKDYGPCPFKFPLVHNVMWCGEWATKDIAIEDLLAAKLNLTPTVATSIPANEYPVVKGPA